MTNVENSSLGMWTCFSFVVLHGSILPSSVPFLQAKDLFFTKPQDTMEHVKTRHGGIEPKPLRDRPRLPRWSKDPFPTPR